MRLLEGGSLNSMIAHNQALGFEGLLRNGELFVEVDDSSRALFVNAESAELEQQVLYSLGDRLRKLRDVLGPRLEQYAILLLLLDDSEPFEDILATAEHDQKISAAEFMDGITWHERNPPEA
jgi:hypothetical protein